MNTWKSNLLMHASFLNMILKNYFTAAKKCLSIRIYGWLGKRLEHNYLKKDFYRNLKIDKGITDFKMKNVGIYHDLYI